MVSHELTDYDDLRRLSENRGKRFDPAIHLAVCGECGAGLSMWGILHGPECSGDHASILFKNR